MSDKLACEVGLAETIRNMREDVVSIRQSQERVEETIKLALDGPPDEPRRGIKNRVQRLEDKVEAMTRLLWIVISAVVTGGIGFTFAYLNK